MIKKIGIGISILFLLFIALTFLSTSQTKINFDTATVVTFNQTKDSVTVIPSKLFEGDGIKKFMQGKNYRLAWQTPIKVPVVYMDTLFNGELKFEKEGGGDQTHTLEFSLPDGTIYCIRSISKNTNNLVPENVRKLNLENIIIDVSSSQHPMSAALVAELSNLINIEHTHPQLIFVPEQDFLAERNQKYGNRLYWLEYESDKTTNWSSYKGLNNILSTEQLIEFKAEKQSTLQLGNAKYIRARLFDIIIGDWDRHAKQWGWVIQKTLDSNFLAVPIAADRDNAFFAGEGVLPTLITSRLFLNKIQPFDSDIRNIDAYVKDIDVYLLKGVSLEEYLEEVNYIQSILTKEQISNAFKIWPKELRRLDEEKITASMLSRIGNLELIARDFKEAIESRKYSRHALESNDDIEVPKGAMACFQCNR